VVSHLERRAYLKVVFIRFLNTIVTTMTIHSKNKDDNRIQQKTSHVSSPSAPFWPDLMLTWREQVVNRSSHGRTKAALSPVIATPVEAVAKQISIQQQFQLVTDEDDDEVSLKVVAQISPSRGLP